jgi:signal transduction histidine kinase
LRREGYVTEQAEDGCAAVDVVARGEIDVVLLDVMMPRLDGVETCRVIRERLAQPFLPVVLVTALHDAAARTRGKEAGADDFITKPVHAPELLARLKKLLHARRLQKALDEERARAHREAKRWRIVSRVAERVGAAGTRDELRARMFEALDELGSVHSVDLVDIIGAGDAPFHARDGGAVVPLVDGGPTCLRIAGDSAADLAALTALAPHIRNAYARVRLAESRAEVEMMRERLAGMLVHDLKNPLAVMQMNLDAIKALVDDGAGANEIHAPIDDALAAAEQQQRMLLDLIDIGRAEDGRLPFTLARGQIGPVVARTAAQWRRHARRRGARFVVDIDEAVPVARFDEDLIARVLQNLLTNATRFVPEGGIVEVRVRSVAAATRREIVIAVENDGPSIAPERRAGIFERYGQTTSDQGHDNRGLGLYLCRLVAECHGGRMSVRDRAGGGTCFELILPDDP